MKQKLSFEQALKRLEEIVKLLDKGEVALEDSLKLYEEGSSLIAFCNETLNNAEQKVTMIKMDNGTVEEVPFGE